MRLARAERDRLWKGLERFVNCGDSMDDYRALSRAFWEFWPMLMYHFPLQDDRIFESLEANEPIRPLTSLEFENDKPQVLLWEHGCHDLFLFYRDVLRCVWSGATTFFWIEGGRPEFLLGLDDLNEAARREAEDGYCSELHCPRGLYDAWSEIMNYFPTAKPIEGIRFGMIWKQGEFCLNTANDFQKAFYMLFRQSWRARVCPRCELFFVAQRPKQAFCGTVCSAGSRLASKRKWWRSVGAKRRAALSGTGVKPSRTRGKRQ
jgi:hypothetical protein